MCAEFESPWLFYDSQPVPSEMEAAEILAKAFSDAAGTYFSRYAQLEAKVVMWTKVLYIGLVIFIFFLLLTIVVNLLLIIFVIIALLILYLGLYNKSKTKKQQDELQPDKRLIYLSKLYIPLYLIPYSEEGVFVFDSRERGKDYTLDTINYKTEDVLNNMNIFAITINSYIKFISDKNIFLYPEIKRYSETAALSKVLEKDIVDSIKKLNSATCEESWVRKTFNINLHPPDSDIAKAIEFLHRYLLKTKNPISIKEYRNMEYFTEKLKLIATVEEENIKGDVEDMVFKWEEYVQNKLHPIKEILEDNINKNKKYYANFFLFNDMMLKRQVCRKCFDTQLNRFLKDSGIEDAGKKDVYSIYNLESFIIRNFSEALSNMSKTPRCPMVYNDEPCSGFLHELEDVYVCDVCGAKFYKDEVNGISASEKAKNHIKEKINVDLYPIPMDGVLFFEPLQIQIEGSSINWRCPVHGLIKESEIADINILTDAFSSTSKNVWDIEVLGPVREKILKAKDRAMSHRQTFKSHRLATLPYKEMSINFDVLLERMRSEIMEAEYLIEKLDKINENRGGAKWQKELLPTFWKK